VHEIHIQTNKERQTDITGEGGERQRYFQPHYGPRVDSASNRNEYQESSWGKGWPARGADHLTVVCEPIV
jgi:hypothetical protein